GSNQTAPPAVFPNFVPSAFVISGTVRPNTFTSSPASISRFLRINSIPAVIFPHWSLPPSCNETFSSSFNFKRSEERRVGKECRYLRSHHMYTENSSEKS